MSNLKYQAYMQSEAWDDLRYATKWRDNFACRLCNSRRKLQVHHRSYPRILGTETVDDLTTLCASCHALISKGSRLTNRDAQMFIIGAAAMLVTVLASCIL